MNHQRITVSSIDRSRLEPLIRDAVAGGSIPRDRLCKLEKKLNEAEVVQPEQMPRDVVTMNSTVRLRDEDTGEVETYTLVYPGFASIADGRLSVLTPIGTAIFGLRKGLVGESETALGTIRVRIEKVEFQPENGGQYDV